jgi:hypothetical protein
MNETELDPDKLRKGMQNDLRSRVASTLAGKASILNASVRQEITEHVTNTVCEYLSDLFGPLS